ncbi:MFS general substrate transporter [Thozetella sp. PMI_491]|nr:MFS general substrate transporter [Thozetella sp. PMI_491]
MDLKLFFKRGFRESGLTSLYQTGRDAWLIILSRCCRMFAYGASSFVLALFFNELHVSDSRIGLFMTLTLVGDVFLSLVLTFIADRVGRRRTLIGGSILMIISGATFALSENYWALLFAAVIGVLSASGGDFGPFRAIEESSLSELTTPATRSDVLVWYITMSTLGSSVGTELSGRIVDVLTHRDGWTILDAYHTVYWGYTIMGGVNMALAMLLSKKCELQKTDDAIDDTDLDAFLEDSDDESTVSSERQPPRTKSGFSQISRQTLSIMLILWFLLMVDSLADGMVNMSLTTYYIDQKFHVSKSLLGDILSASYFLATASSVFAGPLSRHLGLVNTMVFTHIPSSAAVLAFPAPQNIALTFALLLVRVGLNNMDQAPRTALIAAVVKPDERTAVMGITGMLRTLAATSGPTLTGFLADSNRFWIAFVVAGSLRLAYDLGLWAMFINIQLHKYEPVLSASTPMREQRRTTDVEASGEDDLTPQAPEVGVKTTHDQA